MRAGVTTSWQELSLSTFFQKCILGTTMRIISLIITVAMISVCSVFYSGQSAS